MTSNDVTAYKWTTKEYSLQEIYDANEFPIVVMVMGGYYGDSPWETVSSGDVLRLHCRGTNRRVIARDLSSTPKSSNYYSIPVDYEIPFAPIKPKVPGIQRQFKPPVPLKTLLEKESLPLQVQMVMEKNRSLLMKGDRMQKMNIDVIEIRDVYDEKFFKGNSIMNGSLYKDMIVVPTFLKEVRVVKAEGLAARNASVSQWERQMTRWSNAARQLNFAKIGPSKEIMVYAGELLEAANNIYDSIEPQTYASLSPFRSDPQPHVYSAMVNGQTQENRGHEPSTYEDINLHYRTPPEIPTNEKDVTPAISKRPAPPEVPQKPPLPRKCGPESSAKSREGIQENQSEEAEGHEDYMFPAKAETIKTVTDIPKDIRGLGCSELVECLRLLHMGAYIHTFREHQINGELLYSLDEAMLKEDLDISAIHARKLHMFVHNGWRPQP